MVQKHVTFIKLEATATQQKPYISGDQGIALVFWGLLVFAGLAAIVIMIGQATTRRARKPTAEQQDKRARIVAARHKHLSEHE